MHIGSGCCFAFSVSLYGARSAMGLDYQWSLLGHGYLNVGVEYALVQR